MTANNPHFSQGQLICDGYFVDRLKATRIVAPRRWRRLAFCVSPLDLVDDAADWARGSGACQAGEARALAASARRRAARPHSSAAGQAEAMAILMRRQEMRTNAPIFKSLSLMVPQVASAKVVSAKADAPQGTDQHIGQDHRHQPALADRLHLPQDHWLGLVLSVDGAGRLLALHRGLEAWSHHVRFRRHGHA
jgi:hypothetical protein